VNKKGLPVWKLAYSFSVYIILPENKESLYCISGNFCGNLISAVFCGQLRTAEIKIAEYYVKYYVQLYYDCKH
jgi:hypothetical protein